LRKKGNGSKNGGNECRTASLSGSDPVDAVSDLHKIRAAGDASD
jgi:hypothetical protein